MGKEKQNPVSTISNIAAAVASVPNPLAAASITLLGVLSDLYSSKLYERRQQELTDAFCGKLEIDRTEIKKILEKFQDNPKCYESIIEVSKRATLTYSEKSITLMGHLLSEIIAEERAMSQMDFLLLDLLENMNDYDLENLQVINNIFEKNKQNYNEGIYADSYLLKSSNYNDNNQLWFTYIKLQKYYAVDVCRDVSLNNKDGSLEIYSGDFYRITESALRILYL